MSKKSLAKRILAVFMAAAMVCSLTATVPADVSVVHAEGDAAGTLPNGDYYIRNVGNGLYLNAGNAWNTQASAFTYGQLFTITVNDSGTYKIASHYKKNNKDGYLGRDGYMDKEINGSVNTDMTIEKQPDGSYTIKNTDSNYLTAQTDASNSSVVSFAEKGDTFADTAKWQILTREDLARTLIMEEGTEGNTAYATSLIFDSGISEFNDYHSKWQRTGQNPTMGYTQNVNNQNVKPDKNNPNSCVEVYQKTFDSYQILEDVPNGTYSLTVQGFYSGGVQDDALYYINDVTGSLMPIAQDAQTSKNESAGWRKETTVDGVTKYLPDGMCDGSLVFEAGYYENEVITATVTDHTLRVGVKAAGGKNWVMWDNFTLTFDSATETPQQYTEYLRKKELESNILGTNQSFQRILDNITLPETLAGGSASITWQSSDGNVMGNDGKIAANAKNGDTVTMTATVTEKALTGVSQEPWTWTWTYPMRIAKTMDIPETGKLYDFNTDAGGGAALSSDNYALKDYSGEILFGDGRSGKAGDKSLKLDGKYGLEMPLYNLDPEGKNGWTVSVWCNIEEIAGNSPVVFVGSGDGSSEKWIGVAGAGNGNLKAWWNDKTTNASSGATVLNHNDKDNFKPVEGWNMLTITQTPVTAENTGDESGEESSADSSSTVTVYVNGEKYAELTHPRSFLDGKKQTVYLGTNYWDNTPKGLIDDVAVYQKALTAEEVGNAYLSGFGAEEQKSRIQADLEQAILNGNESLSKVTGDLVLPETYYARQLSWSLADSDESVLKIDAENHKASVTNEGDFPKETSLNYTLGSGENSISGTYGITAGTADAFTRAEFFGKTSEEQTAAVKEELEQAILNGNAGLDQIASDLSLPATSKYNNVKVADVSWASSDTDKIEVSAGTDGADGTGTVKYTDSTSEKVKLTATVTYMGSEEGYARTETVEITVRVAKPVSIQPVDIGNTTGNKNDKNEGKKAENSKTSAAMQVGTQEQPGEGGVFNAPGIENVSIIKGENFGATGNQRIGYMTFETSSVLPNGADISNFDVDTLEFVTLKLNVENVNTQLKAKNRMKVGLYPVKPEKIANISNADHETFPAIDDAYDAEHVTWCKEWLKQSASDSTVETDVTITFDVKDLVKDAISNKQEKFAFRFQVPASMVKFTSLGASDETKKPVLMVQYRKSLTADEKAQEDAEALAGIVPSEMDEDCNITLPASIGEFKSAVTWTSDNAAVALAKDETTGAYRVNVTRPENQDAVVTLTASVKNGESTAVTKTFKVKVEKFIDLNGLYDKLLAYFSFDDGTAGLAGAGAKAKPDGTNIRYIDDVERCGKVLSLGNNSYLSVTDASGDDGAPLLKGKESITVSYWSKSNFADTTRGSWTFFAAKNGNYFSGDDGRHYLALLDAKNALKVERYNANNGHNKKLADLTNAWRKVDLVISADKTALYIDGVKQYVTGSGDAVVPLTTILGPSGGVLYIGKATWGSGEYYDGLLDDYRIYDRALTSGEVKMAYDKDIQDLNDRKQAAENEQKVADVKAGLEAPTLSAASTITLPTEKDGCTLVWEIVEPQNSEDVQLSADGKTVTVTRGDNEIIVKLQATITAGEASDTSEVFTVTVPALPKDDEETAAKRAALGKAVAAAEELIKDTVAEDYPEGIWQAFRTAIDEANTAALTGDAAAIDTAKTKLEAAQAAFKSNDEIANAQDTQKVDNAIAGLPTELTFSAGTGKITLPTVEGCQIEWKIVEPENSEDVKLSADKKSVEVTRGDNAITVKLQATVSSGKVSKETDVYTVVVPALPQDDEATAAKREELKTATATAAEKLEGTKAEDYPEGVWQALKEAIAEANTAVASGDKAALEEAEAKLKAAVNAFKTNDEIAAEAEAAAKAQAVAGLNTAIAQKPANAQSYYTPESWKKYQDALTEAQNILKNPDAKSSDINAAKAALEAAFKALTAAATDPGTTPSPDKKVTKLSLNKTKLTLGIKENFTLKATVAPVDAKDKSVTWNTSNKKIVSVKNGKIKGLKKGKATITVTANDGSGKKASCTVTVKPSPTKKTKISVKKSITVKVKKATTLKPKVKGNFGCATFKFTSKNKKVAKVDANGKVTGVKKGKTTITVSTYNKKAKTIVKVTVK